MSFSENTLGKSIRVIRLVGYALLVLASLDSVSLFFPPGFTKPEWELQVMGRLVDSVPVPLIALVMIFFAEQTDRLRIEKQLLRFLSWVCFGFALLHFAMLPLGLGDTWRLNNKNNSDIGNALSRQIKPLIDTETKLKQSNSAQELKKTIEDLVRANPNQTPTITDPEKIRERMLAAITTSTKQIKAESDAVKLSALQNLIRASAKLNIGTVVAAVAYFMLWKLTPWARIGGRRKSRKSSESQDSSQTVELPKS